MIVAAFRDERTISRCLSAVTGQKRAPPFSVFVVLDRNANRETEEKAREFSGKARIVRSDRTTVAGLRNFGLEIAGDFDFIAYTDPDCEPEEGWLRKLVDGIPSDAAAIGGSDPFFEWPGTVNEFMRLDWRARLAGKGYTSWLDSNNLLIRSKDFAEIDGFNENLRFGADSDLSYRLVGARKRLFFEPSARVLHLKRYSLDSFGKEAVKYGRSHALLFISGEGFSKTAASHPGVLFLAQPLLIGTAVLLPIPGGRLPSSLALLALLAIWFSSVSRAPAGRWAPFLGLCALRASCWTFGGMLGTANCLLGRRL